MSADLMVFDKSKEPVEPMQFLKWFYEKTAWTSDRDYYDIKGMSPELVNFFMEIIREYPAMNGPISPSDEEMEKIEDNLEQESRLTEYNIDDDLIYSGLSFDSCISSLKINRTIRENSNRDSTIPLKMIII